MTAFNTRTPIAPTLVLLAIAVNACTDVPTIDDVLVRPTSMSAVGQTAFSVAAGSTTNNPTQVRVLDQDQAPLANQQVSFVASRGTLSSATATTASNGQASPATFTAPTSTAGGPATITTSIPNFASVGTVTFTITITPGAAATQTKTASTDNLSAVAGNATASAPELTVADQYGNSISGVVVTFTVLTGGGTVNGGSSANVTTDATGKARLTSWVLGPTAGAAGSNNNTVRACTTVLPTQCQTFSATGTAGPPNKIVIAPPGNSQGQTATAGSNVAVAPAVLVTDANNNAVGSGVVIRFAIGQGGGKIISATGAQVATLDVNTNASGVATVPGWMVWDLGANTLTVTAPNVTPAPTAFTINATSVAGAPTQIAVETPAVQGQSAPAGTTVGTTPGVVVKDANGFVVSGTSVTFTIDGGTSGVIKMTSGGTDVTTGAVNTDVSGVARVFSWKLGPNKGQDTLKAALTSNSSVSVTILATATAGPPASIAIVTESPSSNNQTTVANTAVPVAPGVVVRDANNLTVDAGVSVTFAIQAPVAGVVSATGCTGTATSVTVNTDANGVARLGCWKPGTVGSNANSLRASVTATATLFVNFTATGTVGPPTAVVFTNQPWGFTRQGFPNRSQGPKVKVADAGGNGVSGLTVNWSNNSNTNGTVGGTTSSLTNASGEATFTGTLTAAGAIGASMVLRADVATTTLNALSSSVLIVGAPNNTSTVTNPPATTTVNGTVAQLPVFIVRDFNNQPVPDVQVTWSYTVNPNSNGTLGAPLTVMPDSLGRTQPAGNWRVSQTAGVNTIQAAMVGTSLTVSFSTTGVASTPTQIAVNGGGGQSAPINTAVSTAPSVIVRDAFNNTTSGVSVTFTPTTGSGSVTGSPANTSASGIATVGSWTLGSTVGTQTLNASLTSNSSVTVAITATGTAADPCATPGTFTIGNTINGSLATSDCNIGSSTPQYADNYTLTVPPSTTQYFSVTLSTPSYTGRWSSFLYPAVPAANWFDTVSTASKTLTALYVVGPGTYTLRSTSWLTGVTGSYTVTSAANPTQPANCGAYLVTKGITINHDLVNNVCTYVKQTETGTASSRIYLLFLPAGQTATIKMNAPAAGVDPYLECFDVQTDAFITNCSNDEGGALNNDAQLTISSSASNRFIRIRATHWTNDGARPAQSGPYTLIIDP